MKGVVISGQITPREMQMIAEAVRAAGEDEYVVLRRQRGLIAAFWFLISVALAAAIVEALVGKWWRAGDDVCMALVAYVGQLGWRR